MECPNCQTVNPDDAGFCSNCGEALTQTCPQCGTVLPADANFCFNCGYKLASAPAQSEARSPLHQFMPRELQDKLHAARTRGDMVGERRIITMLFCDVTGSTAMAGNFDPEEWAEMMNEAFQYLIAPVYRYEGVVARLMGDGLLAFFGAPIAHEDDPVRAVLAGLDIVRGIGSYREHIQAEYGLDFNVRVGINTGSVVVGQIGSDLAVEYTAMGDAINLASRMETTALPGTVQITAYTYKLVAPLFDAWEVGLIQVKGKAEPVQAYRVLGWRPEPGSTRGIEGLDAPLIGREQEMEKLQGTLADLKRGRGGVVCLVGEAGLGKTRLLEEMRAAWRQADFDGSGPPLWLESRGISYEATQPYGLFLAFIRQSMGVLDHDPPQVVRAKITRETAGLPPAQRQLMARVVEAMLGVGGKPDAPTLAGEDFKRELFATLLGSARAIAVNRPTVIVCEDLHWVDPASIELLFHLFQLVKQVPILFVCTYRPYRRGPAEEMRAILEADYPQRYLLITLRPLTEQQSDQLVKDLLDIDDLPPGLRRSILRKTEGNPFFVEEVVRSLMDSGAVIRDETGTRWNAATQLQDIAIPDNVQSLLLARVDRLEREAREILQLAAVIGRSFQHRILKRLVDTAVGLEKQLDVLQRSDLIREVAAGPEPVYMFHHALTRDAAYASILHRHRRVFHRRVAEAIEALYPERLAEEAHRLAEHFFEAREYARALHYYGMAGDHAARIYANTAAATHYERALEIARRNGDATDATRLIQLYSQRGRALEIDSRFDDALANYRELEQLGRETGDGALELAALIPQATLHSTFTAKFNPKRGRALSERALALARDLNDHRAEAKTLWNLMLLALFGDDDQQQALAFGERSLALARANNLKEEMAFTLHDIANVYLDLGRKEEAWAAYEEAGNLWRELGNLPMLVDNLANSAWHPYQRGRLDLALARVYEGLRISRSISSLWGQAYSFMTLGPLHLAAGAYAQGVSALQKAIPLAKQAKFDVGDELRVALGGIYGFLGDLEHGLTLLEKVRTSTNKREDQLLALLMLSRLYLYHGRIAEASAAFDAAKEHNQVRISNPTLSMFRMVAPVIEAEIALSDQAYDRALKLAGDAMAQTRRLTILADLMRIKSEALLALGHVEEAQETMRQARVAAETPDADRMTWLILSILWSRRTVWRILVALGRLEARAGNQAEAQALIAEAQEIVGHIADRAEPLELRGAFLNLSDVRKVLDAKP